MKKQEEELTPYEIKQAFKSKGNKLGFFIHSLNVPDKQKQAWVALLPKMSMEQIDRLINILEAKYLDQETRDVDDKFKKDLEKIKDVYDKKEQDIDDKTIKKLEELVKKIK